MTKKLSDLASKVSWPTAAILIAAFVCITAAYVAGPAEHRDELVAGLGAAFAALLAVMRALVGAK